MLCRGNEWLVGFAVAEVVISQGLKNHFGSLLQILVSNEKSARLFLQRQISVFSL